MFPATTSVRWRRLMPRLFVAAHGGALGLFTAITRLRAVHQRIAPALEARGLMLLAQHVDAMSTATLVDIFRAEENSCLLGTDAVRDGVDIPGRALRLHCFRSGALAASGYFAPRSQAGLRRRAVCRPDRPTAVAAGLWPADPPRRRSRRLHHARPGRAFAPSRRLSRGRRGSPLAAGASGRGDSPVSRHRR